MIKPNNNKEKIPAKDQNTAADAESMAAKISDIIMGRYKIPYSEMVGRGWIVEHRNAKGSVTSKELIDDVLCYELKRKFNFFVLGGVCWYYEDGVYTPDNDGTKIKTLIRMHLPEDKRKDRTINAVRNLLLSDATLAVDETDLNNHESYIANTKTGMFDVLNWKCIAHDPKYRSISQIPHYFDGKKPGEDAGPGIRKFLETAIKNKKDRTSVFELAGESCTKHNEFQRSVIFQGQGATGKSTLLNIITAMVGDKNISHVQLQKLEKDFFPIQLIGKLINLCSDIPAKEMPFTGNFKAAVCGEPINDSRKGKDNFDFTPYAKMWFSCNELPFVKDISNGFYRRLLIITMQNRPSQIDPDLTKRLTTENEIQYFLYQSLLAFHKALKRGSITESDAAKKSVLRYRHANDAVEAFMSEAYETSEKKSDRVKRSEIYKGYSDYCHDAGVKAMWSTEFYEVLRQKGYQETGVNGNNYFCHLLQKTATEDENATDEDDLETAQELFG